MSHDYWRAHLGGDPAAIGRTIRVNDQRLTIVGVTPPRFQGTVLGLNFDMWAPATLAPTVLAGSRELEDRALRGYSALARRRRGVTPGAAQRDVDEAMGELARTFPGSNTNVTARCCRSGSRRAARSGCSRTRCWSSRASC